MDTSFENYGEYPRIGGHMLELDMCWSDDVGDVMKTGFESVDVNNVAPAELVLEDFINFKTDSETTQFETWATQDVDFSLFDNLATVSQDDLGKLLRCDGLADDLPNSPDSGISNASPSSPDVCELSAFPDGSGVGVTQFKDILPSSPDSGVGSPNVALSQGSPVTVAIDGFPENGLFLEFMPGDASLQTPALPVAPEADLAFVEALWQAGPVTTQDGEEILVTTLDAGPAAPGAVATLAPHPGRPSPKKARSSASKPTRSLTSAEKRVRKRAQNKDAATRYREKKRAESQTIYTDQTQLEDKNKDLTDKFNQISREIQYLKELLIEVYRTKGLIE